MADFDLQRLIAILANPSETLSIECKDWLDLSDKRNRATLAKAAIALANHGGGIIAIGIGEDSSKGDTLVCQQRTRDLLRYSSDDIDSAINTYADPSIDFRLKFAKHPGTGEEYPFIEIPGEMLQPVIAKKGYDGVIRIGACYIRKPGPKSEQPSSPQEWRDLYSRCVRANKESLLASIRTIVQGGVETVQLQASDSLTLEEFSSASYDRFQKLVSVLPEDDPARLSHGSFEVTFSLIDYETSPSLRELRDMLRDGPAATRGWPPFISLSREPFTEKVVGGAIECWLGDPEGNRTFNDAYFSPFWRAHPDGCFYQIEGYFVPEGLQAFPPGAPHYPEFTIRRLAHFLLHAHDLAIRFGGGADILLACRFSGLKGKILVGTPRRPIFRHHECHEEDFSFETRVSQVQIRDNLLEIIHQNLSQLYDRISFFDLTEKSVASCLDKLAT